MSWQELYHTFEVGVLTWSNSSVLDKYMQCEYGHEVALTYIIEH